MTNRRASASMLPQLESGGWTPRPRNDTAASAAIAIASENAAWTISGAWMLGNKLPNSRSRVRAPNERAAMM
jgi:hypothetical protein